MKTDEFYMEAVDDYPPHQTWLIRFVVFLLSVLTPILFRWEAHGTENVEDIPEDTGLVLIANHTSYIDPVFLYLAFRRMGLKPRYVYKSELDKSGFLKWFLARLGAIPVKRDTADRNALRIATTALKRGESIGIFPEGTRIRKPGQEVEVHGGFALMAQMGKGLIVPVAITGADRIRPHGMKLFRLPKVHLYIGEPIHPDVVADLPRAERLDALADLSMHEVYRLRDEQGGSIR